MPKSKRDKKVSLTKTKKKGLNFKQQLVQEIRKCIQEYKTIFLFSVQNMRNTKLKDLRKEWRSSRFFFGKNKVMAIGLGKTRETEAQDNLRYLAKHLVGQCGLLFTNKEMREVVRWFDNYSESDYARAGNLATETVTLPAGPLSEFPHSMEPQLRQLGMPTSLEKGVINLLSEYTVCKADQPLKPEQARILKLLGHQMSEFKITMKCMWSRGGTFKKFTSKVKTTDKKPPEEHPDVEMEEDNEEDNSIHENDSSDEDVSDKNGEKDGNGENDKSDESEEIDPGKL